MSKYRKIHTRIWSDEQFLELEPGDKLLWFALLTHPVMTPMGAGVLSPWLLDELVLGNAGGWCYRCQDTCGLTEHSAEGSLERLVERSLVLRDNHLVVVRNFLIYNTPENPNQLCSWIESCEELPRSKVFGSLYEHLLGELGGAPEFLFLGLLEPLSNQHVRGLKARFWERVRTDKPKPPKKRSTKGSAKRSAKPSTEGTRIVSPNQEQEQEQEQEEDRKASGSSEPSATASLYLDICLPLNDGSDYQISLEDSKEWERLYPAVGVIQEIREMRAWCLANSTRRKTRAGIKRFINAWLAKAQDSGHPNGRTPTEQHNRRVIEKVLERDEQYGTS